MIRVFTAFSGYDSQCMALDRLGIDYDLVGWSEIDKYAIMAHNAVYPIWADRNFGDISKINWDDVPDFDLFTYSFPCTDISSAGQQKGLAEDSGTRSSLLWECKRAIETKRPKYLLMENVKALTQKKFLPYLHKWQNFLTSMGYTNFTQVLNAKDYGVPQNRERVFMVSILGDAWFSFTYSFGCQKRLKDVLEKNVDEKYYLSNRVINTFTRRTIEAKKKGNGFAFVVKSENDIANVVKTRAGSQIEDNYIFSPFIKQYPRGFNPGFEFKEGYSPAITTSSWEHNNYLVEPNVLTPKRTEYGKQMRKAYESGEHKESRHNMTQMEPREDGISNTITTVQKDNILLEPSIIQVGNIYDQDKNPQSGRVYNKEGICPTIDTMLGGNREPKIIDEEENINIIHEVKLLNLNNENLCMPATGVTDNYRIRKLTPRECFRLMGVSESDIDKIQAAEISRTQQYKMAGNSIVVDVLYYIFKELFREC